MFSKITLSSNQIKIIAALSMLADHVGLLLFPEIEILRIIGRLAFGLYAYLMAQGCFYTKNRKRHFFEIFALGVFCQIVSTVFTGDLHMNVLLTFSLSILMIYAYDLAKEDKNLWYLPVSLIISSFILCELLCLWAPLKSLHFDYGFFGAVLPLMVHIGRNKNEKLALLALGLVAIAAARTYIQYFSLLSVLILWLYNGRRGKLKMKYFFYIFYPLHLAILYLIAELL